MANISLQSWFLSSDPLVLEETNNTAFLQGQCTRETAQGKNGLAFSAACEESNENNVWKLSSCDLTSLEESSPLHRIALILSSWLLPLACFHHCRWSAGHVSYQPALFSCASKCSFWIIRLFHLIFLKKHFWCLLCTVRGGRSFHVASHLILTATWDISSAPVLQMRNWDARTLNNQSQVTKSISCRVKDRSWFIPQIWCFFLPLYGCPLMQLELFFFNKCIFLWDFSHSSIHCCKPKWPLLRVSKQIGCWVGHKEGDRPVERKTSK